MQDQDDERSEIPQADRDFRVPPESSESLEQMAAGNPDNERFVQLQRFVEATPIDQLTIPVILAKAREIRGGEVDTQKIMAELAEMSKTMRSVDLKPQLGLKEKAKAIDRLIGREEED